MSGRLTLSLMAVIAALGAGPARAQDHAPGNVTTAQGWQSGPEYVEQAGFGQHGQYYDGGPPSPIYTELVPDHTNYDHYSDPMFDLAVADVFEGIWCELEYLNYAIKAPGDTLLGAELSLVPNPRDPFFVTLPNNFVGIARVEDDSTVNFNNMSGIRTRIGIPFKYFSLEGVFWGLSESTDFFTENQIPPNAPQNFQSNLDFIGTSLLTDGQPGGRVILYDGSFEFTYRSQIWAAESNLYLNVLNPQTGLRIHPLIGARFEQYDENLVQRGMLNNSSGAFGLDLLGNPIIIDPVENEIRAGVENSRFMGQAGLRLEFVDDYFTLGVEPKFGLGGSNIDAHVYTNNLRDTPTDPDIPPVLPAVDDGETFDTITYGEFSATFDCTTYAKWHVCDWFDLKVGYNFLWMANVSRADDSIFYNDLGILNPPAVVAQKSTNDIWIQGLSVGGTLTWP